MVIIKWKMAIREWLRIQQSREFYRDGIFKTRANLGTCVTCPGIKLTSRDTAVP
jgi:hypothetical protein